MKRGLSDTEDSFLVSKRSKHLTPSCEVTFSDLPIDCIWSILKKNICKQTPPQILSLLTISKHFRDVCLHSSMLFDLFQFLINSEIGNQIMLNKKKMNSWKYFFKIFYLFTEVQFSQFVYYHYLGNKIIRAHAPSYLKSTIKEFKIKEGLIGKINSWQQLGIDNSAVFPIKPHFTTLDFKLLEPSIWNSARSLNFPRNRICGIPSSISLCSSLTSIYFQSNCLVYIPPEIGTCINLERIDFSKNRITKLPKEIGQLKKLIEIRLSQNKIKKFPKELNWKKLKFFYCTENQLQKNPNIFNSLEIQHIDLYQNNLKKISKKFNFLKNLNRLDLRKNEISFIKQIIFKNFEKLRFLFLSDNPLQEICDENIPLSLEYFYCSKTEITSLPSSIGSCLGLREINLQHSSITQLPSTISNCIHLQSLNLSFTQITFLPSEIVECVGLLSLDLRALNLTNDLEFLKDLKKTIRERKKKRVNSL